MKSSQGAHCQSYGNADGGRFSLVNVHQLEFTLCLDFGRQVTGSLSADVLLAVIVPEDISQC